MEPEDTGQDRPSPPRRLESIATIENSTRFATIGIFLILMWGVLYFAQGLLLPVMLAFLFAFVLWPIVRWLKRHGVPEGLTAALLVVTMGLVLAGAVYGLSGPVTKWVNDAPQIGAELREKLASLQEPMQKVQEAQEQVNDATQQQADPGVEEVVVREPGLLNQAAKGVPNFVAGATLTLVLLLFLLATGNLTYEKLVQALPKFSDKKKGLRIARDIERELSRYFFTITAINIGLGVCVAFGMFALGMPNPLLWGVLATILNFIPYLGAVVGIAMVGTVALVSLSTLEHAALVPAWYMLCTVIEGQFVTPPLVGRRVQINPVAVFLAIAFWGWLWGFAGLFVAVPTLITIKVFSQHFDALTGMAVFLSPREKTGLSESEVKEARRRGRQAVAARTPAASTAPSGDGS